MCGKKGYSFNTFFAGELGEHSFDQERPDWNYVKSEATKESSAVFYKTCMCGMKGEETFSYGEPLQEYTTEEKKGYLPRSLTVTLYDTATNTYGFTYSTLSAPLRPVLQIAKGDSITGDVEEVNGRIQTAVSQNKDGSTLNYFVVKMEVQLEPNESYTYRAYDKYVEIGTDTATLETKDLTTDSFSFAHVSDSQMSDGSSNAASAHLGAILGQVVGKNDFLLHTGDIVQNSKYEYEWWDMLDTNFDAFSRLPVMALAGNHEGDYAAVMGTKELYKHFNIPVVNNQDITSGQYYSFVYGNAKFIMLNANDRVSERIALKQYEWLVEELKNNDSTWTIVAMHQPMYSPGRWGSGSTPGDTATSLGLRAQMKKLFADYGVDLVLQGHDHVVSRTFPINASGEPMKETWQEVDGVQYSVDPDGVIYVMNGPSGNQARTPVAEAEAKYYDYKLSSFAKSWGEITIDGNQLTLTAQYVSGSGSTVYKKWGIMKSE
jgi:3',5'-cyclic AMP phosphodiesterase CpdA